MLRDLRIRRERLALRAPFRISRGVKTHAEPVIVEVFDRGARGLGECTPYARYGETPESIAAQLEPLIAKFRGGIELVDLVRELPPGAARNALDCAGWDFRARAAGVSVSHLLHLPKPRAIDCAVTISLDAPEAMARAAAAVAGAPVIKIKVGADDPAARISAVAAAAPGAKLIVDPNEGWTGDILQELAPLLAQLPVAFVEQPLPADADACLRDLRLPVAICADESVHTADDLPALRGKYDLVNIKLDKTGGLTEALRLLTEARAQGFGVMCGCMVASSWAIAPALIVAAQADWADLDGPWWIADDRVGGVRLEGGRMHPPEPGFWGEASLAQLAAH